MTASVVLLLAVATAGPPVGEVVLPLSQYNQLVNEGNKPPVAADPPVESSVRQAAYTVSATGKLARVRLSATVDVLAPGGAVQPLLGSASALVLLKVDGQPAGASVEDDHYTVPLAQGTHQVEMEVVVPVESEGPSELRLSVPQALSARLNAELPGTNLNVQVEGVENVELRRAGARTVVSAALPVSDGLALTWVPQGPEDLDAEEEEAPRPEEKSTPGKARAVVMHHVGVDEAVLRGTVRATLSVQKGTRSQVALTLPASVEVLDVQAPDLREWNAAKEGDLKKVLVSFKYGRTGELPITVRYERALGEASEKRVIEVPEPIVLDVEAERGFVGIETAPGVEVTLQQSEGAEALDGRDLPADLWSMSSTPLVLGVKYLEHPVRVSLGVSQRAKVAVADTTLDRADFETVVNAEGRAVSAVNYAVRNHQRQYLEVQLPKDTEVLSCFVGGRPVRPARGAGDTLFIPLNRSTAAEGSGAAFPVELVIAQQLGKLGPLSSVALTMPATAVQAMDLSWRVYVPVSHTGLSFGGNFTIGSDPRRTNRWFSVLTPAVDNAYAGGLRTRSKAESLEGYDYSQGVKARFQQRREESQATSAVRVSRPLVGRRYDFRANLLRSEAPQVSLFLIKQDAMTGLGWLSVLLALAGAILWAERKRGVQGISGSAPASLVVGGVMLGLLIGLYVDHVVTRVLLALLAAPASRIAILVFQTHRAGLRKLGYPFLALATGFWGIAVSSAVLGQTLSGALVTMVIAYGLVRLARRFPKRDASTTAPPSGTPVAGGSSTGGAA